MQRSQRVRKQQLLALFFAALAIAARLPFLLTGKIPFDSDEAVEGLMARHVLDGELPAFFWGQAFKGVPEVYASAAAFALFGSSVTVLKSVTLVLFALYVALNFVLLDRLTSRWVATCASLLLVLAPPALVFWSLDASAEYIVIMLLGTVLLLLCLADRAEGREQRAEKRRLLVIGLVVGLALWVHQLFVVYLIPLLLIRALRSDRWKRRDIGRLTRVALALGAIAVVYLLLGIIAFLSGGFSLQLGSVTVSATAPQKMARIAIGMLVLAALVQVVTATSRAQVRVAMRRYWPIAAGFLVGYAPVLLYSIFVEPARSPARVANLRQLMSASPDIFGNIVPILAGFKVPPTTDRLPLPVVAALPGATALVAYLWCSRRRLLMDFFALFVVFFPLLFLASGAYLDTQSYRYFIPWYAGLSIAWAVGSLGVAHVVRLKPDTTYYLASTIVAAIIAVHAWQQMAWYQKLQPDTQSIATIDCLKRNGIRGGYAEYWTAYKLTFIAQERVIIAPTDGIDRYPRYTEYVRSLPAREQINVGSGACP
jgi:4-amino-4-deoxy-L-arabinose transferase-like glycosyltransferase